MGDQDPKQISHLDARRVEAGLAEVLLSHHICASTRREGKVGRPASSADVASLLPLFDRDCAWDGVKSKHWPKTHRSRSCDGPGEGEWGGAGRKRGHSSQNIWGDLWARSPCTWTIHDHKNPLHGALRTMGSWASWPDPPPPLCYLQHSVSSVLTARACLALSRGAQLAKGVHCADPACAAGSEKGRLPSERLYPARRRHPQVAMYSMRVSEVGYRGREGPPSAKRRPRPRGAQRAT